MAGFATGRRETSQPGENCILRRPYARSSVFQVHPGHARRWLRDDARRQYREKGCHETREQSVPDQARARLYAVRRRQR